MTKDTTISLRQEKMPCLNYDKILQTGLKS